MLLLDQPLDGLDIDSRTMLREVFIELLAESERILVIATHRAEDLVGLVDHVITVHDNSVSAPVELDIVRENFPTLTGSKDVIEEIVSRKKVVDKRPLGGIYSDTHAEAFAAT